MLIDAETRRCNRCSDTHLCRAPESANNLRPQELPHLRGYSEKWLEPVYTSSESTRSSEVYAHYLRWCDRGNMLPVGRKAFAQGMRALGAPGFKSSVVYYPVRIRKSPREE